MLSNKQKKEATIMRQVRKEGLEINNSEDNTRISHPRKIKLKAYITL